MKANSQATILNVVCDDELLLLSIIVSDRRKQVRMGQPPYPSHVLLKLFLPDIVHLLEPLHHYCWAIQQSSLVRRAKTATAQNLSRGSQQLMQIKPLPIISQKR